ncbi:hypothetical protein, partial [Streptomyces sp. NPDC057623]|uniref:hypothetical protein n=1 Tax=Streptomyces sp. NPDC057623 TaxID=3346187 RepID=UPI0036C3EEEA
NASPCRPAPWTLRLQTGRLGSIQQVRGMTTGFFAGREALRNVDVAISAVAGRVNSTEGTTT